MSDYLTRLTTRAHGSDEFRAGGDKPRPYGLTTRARGSDDMQALRPFVRSASPITEHDQRIGATALEGFELIGAPSDPTSSASAVGQLGELQARQQPGMTPEVGLGQTTVQQKTAAPAVAEAAPSPRTAPAGVPAASAWTDSGIPAATLEKPGSERSPSSAAAAARGRVAELAAASIGVVGATHENESDKPRARHDATSIKPSPRFPKTSAVVAEPSGPAPESAGPDIPGSDRLEAHAPTRQVGRVVVHTRSVRRQSEIDSPRLEPKTQGFAERFEPSPADAAASSTEPDEGPNVVIGRINVEVLPPAAQQAATATRPGPLTAASVSVIGPLGGGAHRNVSLSLRYR